MEARYSAMSEALKTEFCGTEFRNPVLLASGTCGFGQEINEDFDLETRLNRARGMKASAFRKLHQGS